MGVSSKNNQDKFGGFIELISLKSVINYGTISVDGVGDGGIGGTILIKCESFINYGKISAVGKGGNGMINVHVGSDLQFKNEDIVNPKPNICINTTKHVFTPSDLVQDSLNLNYSLLTGETYGHSCENALNF